MSNPHTSKIQAILKVAHAKKQVASKVPLAKLLQYAKFRQAKKASTTPPLSLYCRLVASMAKTAEQEKEEEETAKAETSKSESSKSPSSSNEKAKPTETVPKSAIPKPTATTHVAPKPATGQGVSHGFDLRSILSSLQPYAAPVAVATGVGGLGSLLIPQGASPSESAQQYRRQQGQRMMVGGLAGGGTAAALLAAYNTYKSRSWLQDKRIGRFVNTPASPFLTFGRHFARSAFTFSFPPICQELV